MMFADNVVLVGECSEEVNGGLENSRSKIEVVIVTSSCRQTEGK